MVCGSLNMDDVSSCGVCGRDFRPAQPVTRKGPSIKTITKKVVVLIIAVDIIVFGWLLPTIAQFPFSLTNANIPLFVLLASFASLLAGSSLAIASLGAFKDKLPGLIWGSAQALIVAGSAVTGILFVPPYFDPDVALTSTAQLLAQGSLISVGLLAGYVLGEAEPTVKALFLSQVVGQPSSFFILFYGSHLREGGNGYQTVFVFLIGLTVLFFIYATFAGFSGAFLASSIASIGRYRMNLKLVSIGLTLSVAANFFPYSTWVPAPSSFSQTQDWFVSFIGGSDWPVSVAVMLTLILTGSIVTLLGLSRRGTATSKQVGLVLVASLFTIGVTVASLSYVITVSDWCVTLARGCVQSEDFLHILWILPFSLLVPTFVIIGSVASKFRAMGYR